MCHRSEAADVKIKDLTQVYDEGDLVKAVVLKVNTLIPHIHVIELRKLVWAARCYLSVSPAWLLDLPCGHTSFFIGFLCSCPVATRSWHIIHGKRTKPCCVPPLQLATLCDTVPHR